jgi:hypothetical protein
MQARQLPSPERLSPAGRASEIATILALAILRTHAEQGHAQSPSGLDFPARKRLHATPSQQGSA